MANPYKPTKEERALAHDFLKQFIYKDPVFGEKPTYKKEWWEQSYPSWKNGSHRAWNYWGMGGTYTMAAIIWYQHIHKAGSKQYNVTIIMRAVVEASRISQQIRK